MRPLLSEEKKISISSGRHPLVEQQLTFVANDTYSGIEDTLIKIITGPCNSGKTTYLKQLSMIVFMAHIGSYVPADEAVIGILSCLITKIDVYNNLILMRTNPFLQDIQQVSRFF